MADSVNWDYGLNQERAKVKMRNISILAVTVLVLFGLTGFSQRAEHTPVDLIGANCSAPPPAKVWAKGNIVHVRGKAALHGIVSDSPLVTGTDMMVLDYDLNTKTGKGTLHGRITIYPVAVEGTWEGVLSGQFYGGRTYLQIVAHGTGVLFGFTSSQDSLTGSGGLTS